MVRVIASVLGENTTFTALPVAPDRVEAGEVAEIRAQSCGPQRVGSGNRLFARKQPFSFARFGEAEVVRLQPSKRSISEAPVESEPYDRADSHQTFATANALVSLSAQGRAKFLIFCARRTLEKLGAYAHFQYGPVAQRESGCLIRSGSGVRLPLGIHKGAPSSRLSALRIFRQSLQPCYAIGFDVKCSALPKKNVNP